MQQTDSRKKRKKGSPFVTAILVLIMIAGLGIALYPTLSDWWNKLTQRREIRTYTEAVEEIDPAAAEAMLREAEAYNETLLKNPARFDMTDEEREIYTATLDITGTGIMGYVEIPSIHVSLPIYHGTNEKVLQVAIGHIEGSSLPVGGRGTHAVISGHRGLPSARLFTDIDRLKEGDHFRIRVLTRTVTYEVDQIKVVLPEEMDDLEIDPNEDYCTLITCTPYGVNTHRLLVRGTRIENDPEDEIPPTFIDGVDPVLLIPLVAAPCLLVVIIVILILTRKRKREDGN